MPIIILLILYKLEGNSQEDYEGHDSKDGDNPGLGFGFFSVGGTRTSGGALAEYWTEVR